MSLFLELKKKSTNTIIHCWHTKSPLEPKQNIYVLFCEYKLYRSLFIKVFAFVSHKPSGLPLWIVLL